MFDVVPVRVPLVDVIKRQLEQNCNSRTLYDIISHISIEPSPLAQKPSRNRLVLRRRAAIHCTMGSVYISGMKMLLLIRAGSRTAITSLSETAKWL